MFHGNEPILSEVMKPYTHQNVTHLIYDVMSYGLLIIFMLSARIIFHNNLNNFA